MTISRLEPQKLRHKTRFRCRQKKINLCSLTALFLFSRSLRRTQGYGTELKVKLSGIRRFYFPPFYFFFVVICHLTLLFFFVFFFLDNKWLHQNPRLLPSKIRNQFSFCICRKCIRFRLVCFVSMHLLYAILNTCTCLAVV